MDDLEVVLSIQLHDANPPNVLGPGIGLLIAHRGVTDFENFLRHLLTLIALQSLQQTRNQRRADDLKLFGFRI